MIICKKTSFSSEKSAMEYVDILQKTSQRKVVPHRAYLCEKCISWHLTSLKTREESVNGITINEYSDLLKKIKNLENSLANKNAELANKNAEINSKKNQIENQDNIIRKKNAKIDDLNDIIVRLNRKISIYDKKQFEELKNKIK